MADIDTQSSLSNDVQLFAVIGAQRTGTNILREVLNTNDQIAMLGEIFSPSSAPAHWENFCRGLPARTTQPESIAEAQVLLDRYFGFVRYRVRNHWESNRKSRSHAIGVDIKYNQLRLIAPTEWESKLPFMLSYLRSRGVVFIHTTRNVIHSAISTMIASQRNLWHNYDGAAIEGSYEIDIEECVAQAHTIKYERESFLNFVQGCKLVGCRYERLMDDLDRAGSGERIPLGSGPLRNIAEALGSLYDFRYDRRLQKAINIPYSRLLSNYDALIRRLEVSEFDTLVATLD